jgi:hypothetical protein
VETILLKAYVSAPRQRRNLDGLMTKNRKIALQDLADRSWVWYTYSPSHLSSSFFKVHCAFCVSKVQGKTCSGALVAHVQAQSTKVPERRNDGLAVLEIDMHSRREERVCEVPKELERELMCGVGEGREIQIKSSVSALPSFVYPTCALCNFSKTREVAEMFCSVGFVLRTHGTKIPPQEYR